MSLTKLIRSLVAAVLTALSLVPLQSAASSFGVFACAPITSLCQDNPIIDPTGPLAVSALDTPTPGILGQAGIGGNLGHVSGSTRAVVSVGNTSGSAINVGGGQAQAGSQWEDNWAVNVPGLAGTAGTLTASILVDADALVFVNTLPIGALGACADAGWGLNFSGGEGNLPLINIVGGNGICEDEGGLYPQNYGNDGAFSFSAPIIFGEAHGWYLDWRATSQVYGWVDNGGTLSGSAELMFLNTVQWLGITAVQDANGAPVDFSVMSESGVDWINPVHLQAVPLPAGVWLLGTGLAGLAFRNRFQPTKKSATN